MCVCLPVWDVRMLVLVCVHVVCVCIYMYAPCICIRLDVCMHAIMSVLLPVCIYTGTACVCMPPDCVCGIRMCDWTYVWVRGSLPTLMHACVYDDPCVYSPLILCIVYVWMRVCKHTGIQKKTYIQEVSQTNTHSQAVTLSGIHTP